MRMFKPILLLLILAVCTFGFSSYWGRYVEITSQPERASSQKNYEVPESAIATQVKINYKDVESVVNDLFDKPFSDSGTGEYREKYQAKTKNPLYDPVEWIKTKNPLYNPTKWIKVFGIKTKNPLYNPTKWIKTKNPKYDPNKWIYADVVEIQIGYRYQYSIARRERITLEAIGNDKLRIAVPLSIDGNVGFRGDLAKIGQVDKKNIKAKANVRMDVGVDLGADWCPKVDANLDIQWVSGPAIEIAGGVWLDLQIPTRLTTPEFEKEAENALENAIDCRGIRDQVAQFVRPSSIELSGPVENMFLNIEPLSVSTSGLILDQEYLRLQVASTLNIEVADTPSAGTDGYELPSLAIDNNPANFLRIGLPLRIRYSELEAALNQELDPINRSIAELVENGSTGVADEIERLEVVGFELYPSGDSITVGVAVVFKATKDIFSAKGRLFLSAKPVISASGLFELADVRFTTLVDNPIYPVILSIAQEVTVARIEDLARIDLAPTIEYGKSELLARIQGQLDQVNGLDLTIEEITVDPSQDFATHEEYLSKRVYIHSGFEAEIKVRELLATG